MKLKHTQAKYGPHGSRFEKYTTLGKSERKLKRDHLQPNTPKTFGLHVVRTQRVRLKETGIYGTPLYKTIKHAAG